MLAFLVCASVSAAEVIDRVVAVVAGDVILMSDVRAAQDLGLVDTAGAPDPVRAALSRLIDRALILDEVERYAPPEPSADAIDRAMNDVRARLASPQVLAAALARAGMDEARLRTILRQNLRVEAYLTQRFAADTPERSRSMIDEWIAGLRGRAEIVDLYTR